MEKIKQLIFSTTARSAYVTTTSDISLTLLAAITTALVARNLNPTEFGTFISLWTFLTLVAAVCDLGIGGGIIAFVAKTTDRPSQNRYVGASLVFISLISLVQLVIIVTGVSSWQRLLFPGVGKSLIILTGIGSGLLIIGRFINDALRAEQQFTRSALTTILFALIRLLLISWLIAKRSLNLATAVAIMSLSPLIYLLVGYLLLNLPWNYLRWNWQPLKSVVVFSGWLGVNQIATTVSGRVDILLLNRLAGATSAGIYGVASLMARVFVIITSSLLAVFAPRLIQLTDKYKQKTFLIKAGWLIAVIWLGMLSLGLTAKPLITLVFSKNYLPALPVFYLLLISMGLLLASIPIILPLIYIIRRPIIVAYLSTGQLITVALGSFWLIPRFGVIAPAIMWILSQALIVLIGGWFLIKWWTANENHT